jgi:hypothetical protein
VLSEEGATYLDVPIMRSDEVGHGTGLYDYLFFHFYLIGQGWRKAKVSRMLKQERNEGVMSNFFKLAEEL